MTLSTRTLIVRAFFFFYRFRLAEEQARLSVEHYRREGTNLCHLIRVVFIWLPLRSLFYAACVAIVLITGYLLVDTLFFGPLGWPFGALLLDLVAIGLLIGVAIVRSGRALKAAAKARPPRPPAPPSSAAIALAWLKAKKRRICPLVEFTE